METLEVFFDYICPFCYEAHEYLKTLLPEYPTLGVVFHPCESHPRPDSYGPHSDLMIRGMFLAEEEGVDLWQYHDRMYSAAHIQRVDVEDAHALADQLADWIEPQRFVCAMEEGEYLEQLAHANQYAYKQNDVWVVPAYRMNGEKLDAVENIGVDKIELRQFIISAM